MQRKKDYSDIALLLLIPLILIIAGLSYGLGWFVCKQELKSLPQSNYEHLYIELPEGMQAIEPDDLLKVERNDYDTVILKLHNNSDHILN